MTSHKIFSEAELKSRCEIMLDNYCKTVLIEANTMIDMAKTEIAPAVSSYVLELANTAVAKQTVDALISCRYENDLLKEAIQTGRADCSQSRRAGRCCIEITERRRY